MFDFPLIIDAAFLVAQYSKELIASMKHQALVSTE